MKEWKQYVEQQVREEKKEKGRKKEESRSKN